MVMANGDQALAAEPGFHDDAPQSGGSGMMSIHRLLDHRSELLEQQSKNGLALAVIPAAVLGGVMEDGAGGAALEATAGPVVEAMGGEFHTPCPDARPKQIYSSPQIFFRCAMLRVTESSGTLGLNSNTLMCSGFT